MTSESVVGPRNKVRVHKRRTNNDLEIEVSPVKHAKAQNLKADGSSSVFEELKVSKSDGLKCNHFCW